MKLETRSNTEAGVVTVVMMVLTFVLLWYIYISAPLPEEEEGVEVSLGESEIGGGRPEYTPEPAVSAPAIAASPTPAPRPKAIEEKVMTQDAESDVQIRQQEEAKRAQQEAEAARRKEEQEALRREQARKEAEAKALAEQQAREQAAKDKASKLGSLFGQTNSDEGAGGQGESASSATKGNPLGHGSSGGNSWKLGGRRLTNPGGLPKPKNDFDQEGKVVVNIIVDATGKVVSAQVGAGSTISNEKTRQLAIKAAYEARFDMVDRPDKAMGTITYNFKLR